MYNRYTTFSLEYFVKKILTLLLATLTSISLFANQGDLSIQVRTIGEHFSSGNYNNNLFGAGVEYEPIERFKIGYLYARNSFATETRHSNYIQTTYDFYRNKEWSAYAGVTAGDNYKTSTQSDVKYFGIVGACNQLAQKIQLCANLSPVSTGNQVQSGSLIAKFYIN